VSAEATTHSEKPGPSEKSAGPGPEQECLGDTDNNMDVDEEVDINIDPSLRETWHQPQAGPSRSVLPSDPPSVSIIPSRSPSPSVDLAETFTFSSFISNTADECRPTTYSSSIANTEDLSSDPALQIDRLTGISSPLTRAPKASQKTVTTAPFVMSSARGSKAMTKGKQKQKEAVTDLGADESCMDTDKGS